MKTTPKNLSLLILCLVGFSKTTFAQPPCERYTRERHYSSCCCCEGYLQERNFDRYKIDRYREKGIYFDSVRRSKDTLVPTDRYVVYRENGVFAMEYLLSQGYSWDDIDRMKLFPGTIRHLSMFSCEGKLKHRFTIEDIEDAVFMFRKTDFVEKYPDRERIERNFDRQ